MKRCKQTLASPVRRYSRSPAVLQCVVISSRALPGCVLLLLNVFSAMDGRNKSQSKPGGATPRSTPACRQKFVPNPLREHFLKFLRSSDDGLFLLSTAIVRRSREERDGGVVEEDGERKRERVEDGADKWEGKRRRGGSGRGGEGGDLKGVSGQPVAVRGQIEVHSCARNKKAFSARFLESARA